MRIEKHQPPSVYFYVTQLHRKFLVGAFSLFIPMSVVAQPLAESDHGGWLSIMPPLIAIGAALTLRSVIPALFLGVWFGAWALSDLGPAGLWEGLLAAFQVYVLEAMVNRDHVAIILFSFMIGGLVGIISCNGGTQGIVNHVVKWAHSRRRGQFATVFIGLIVFIDDYANTLVVGNTMRPVTDRLRISREKLAYLVDSTAAPIAALALVTTWIGYQVGLIGEALQNIQDLNASPYLLFLNSLAYSFYPWLCIVLLLLVCGTGRDIGPMVRAEKLAIGGKSITRSDNPGPDDRGAPERAVNALLPVGVLVGGVAVGLWVTGEGESLRDIVGSADSYAALMWASLVAVMVALALSLAQRLASLDELIDAWADGVKSMVYPMIILVLAWALAETTTALGTADFLVSVMGNSLPVGFLPALVFMISAATAFATGTSWGTMGILMPLVIPLAWSMLQQVGMTEIYVLHSAIAAVLAGAVWGDHCSPISDTTILSSMASGCNHMDHVTTQIPYALLAGGTALVVGVLPSGFGVPWWLSLMMGIVLLHFGLQLFGRQL